MASALLDRDPMIAISARSSNSSDTKSQKQNIPLNTIFETAVKWSQPLDGKNTRQTIATAIDIATNYPRGPVFLTLPNEIAVSSNENTAGQSEHVGRSNELNSWGGI